MKFWTAARWKCYLQYVCMQSSKKTVLCDILRWLVLVKSKSDWVFQHSRIQILLVPTLFRMLPDVNFCVCAIMARLNTSQEHPMQIVKWATLTMPFCYLTFCPFTKAKILRGLGLPSHRGAIRASKLLLHLAVSKMHVFPDSSAHPCTAVGTDLVFSWMSLVSAYPVACLLSWPRQITLNIIGGSPVLNTYFITGMQINKPATRTSSCSSPRNISLVHNTNYLDSHVYYKSHTCVWIT